MLTQWNNWQTPKDPFAMLDAFRREMDRIFYDFDRGFGPDLPRRGQLSTSASWPKVDLHDAKNELVVRAELPGVEQDDLDLTIQEQTFTLKGERKDDAPEGYTAHRRERGAIRFSRTFSLPCKVDAEKAAASLKNGVLTVKIAKAAEVQPRQITVKAG